ncbi:hypothetical protein PF005_g20783 [Phytophthora fragariae]|uniref:Uncharacterized protein n=2 Tax=Phytophthora fragariae TaxID=53985 RepID=A0A6A3S9M0_9STRA|nr:hypothetical protein PF007_g21822 [Phytophthora fragariae]KAE9109162.1 hypothetical protein PF006_g20729 [Phytophthora fragariae]KAE9186609.1 hypothetical protein PF005_g20783 [Phytophthora fragariae]KAE9199424.1 hypothetical protein PF002_g22151 [Phytophthora fragariae]KAE9287848.1 hypothetical protein PF001_g20798 [Phytophthora fragariae]
MNRSECSGWGSRRGSKTSSDAVEDDMGAGSDAGDVDGRVNAGKAAGTPMGVTGEIVGASAGDEVTPEAAAVDEGAGGNPDDPEGGSTPARLLEWIPKPQTPLWRSPWMKMSPEKQQTTEQEGVAARPTRTASLRGLTSTKRGRWTGRRYRSEILGLTS